MNIVIVLEATLGGIRKHVVDLVKGLAAQGYQVTFIYSTRRADERFKNDILLLKNEAARCIELPMKKSVFNLLNIYCILKMFWLFRANKIEVIHLHGAVAGALGRLAALFNKKVRKIIYSPHGGVLHKVNKTLSGKIYVFIEKLLVTKKVFFIAVSTDEKEKLSAILHIPSSKILLIPNGIDLEALTKQKRSATEIGQKRKALNLEPTDMVLLYPALFLEAKGHIHFFETIISNGLILDKGVTIILAGDGPLKPSVQSLVQKLPFRDQIIFAGFIEEIDFYFQLADAVLLPSINEAFGYVLIEAMAYQKPVFATNVGGIKDIVINKESGFLYELDNLSAMVTDINYYNQNPQLLKQIGTTSVKTVFEKFNLDNTIAQSSNFYKN